MNSVASLPLSSWPAARKAAAATFGLVGVAALACAALYLSAVLFLLLNKANPRQAQLASIVSYWDRYSDDPQLRKKLLGSIIVSGFGLLVVLPGALLVASRHRRPLHGDARFANGMEIARARLLEVERQSPVLAS